MTLNSQKLLTYQSLPRNPSLIIREQIEIFVSCQDLRIKSIFPKHFPSIALYIERDGAYELKSKTEEQKKNITNPTFLHSFKLDYIPSLKQNLKFLVMATKNDGSEKIIGVVHTPLNTLFDINEQTTSFDIVKGMNKDVQKLGKLILKVDHVTPTSNFARMIVHIDDLKKPSRGLFQKGYRNLSFQLLRSIRNNAEYVPVFESEVHKSSTTDWHEIQIGLQKLCNGDYSKLIKLILIDNKSSSEYSIIGETILTVHDLVGKKEIGYTAELISPKTRNPIGNLTIYNFDLIENPEFFDYVSAGLQFTLLLGIDYTISNGDPKTSESLHSTKEGLNEYEKAINGIFKSLLSHSIHKKVRMFGFGGKEVSTESGYEHCFPLTPNDNRIHVNGLDGILKVYRESLKKVEFGSPSYLEPLIHQGKKVAKYIQDTAVGNEYVVLVIMTDGKSHDMEDTINKIVESSKFPLSIVIVGLGGGDFSKMEILGGGHGLIDKRGNPSLRNIMTFVQFRKFQSSRELIGRYIMERISEQVLEYMSINGILPENIRPRKEKKHEFNQELTSPRPDIEEDHCEEDKNKNISILKSPVKMDAAFFKTFESTTQASESSDENVNEDDRSQSISSFYKNQGKKNLVLYKCLDLMKGICHKNPQFEDSESEDKTPTFMRNNLGNRPENPIRNENINFTLLQSHLLKAPTLGASTLGCEGC